MKTWPVFKVFPFLYNSMPVACFPTQTAHLLSLIFEEEVQSCHFTKPGDQGLQKTMNTTVCRIWCIFISNSIGIHKREVIGSPIAFQEQSQCQGTSPPLGMTQNITSPSFHFTSPSFTQSSSSCWVAFLGFSHVLLLFSLSWKVKRINTWALEKSLESKLLTFKNKGPYSQADFENCFGMYLNPADVRKT